MSQLQQPNSRSLLRQRRLMRIRSSLKPTTTQMEIKFTTTKMETRFTTIRTAIPSITTQMLNSTTMAKRLIKTKGTIEEGTGRAV